MVNSVRILGLSFIVALATASACASKTDGEAVIGGETNWLAHCEDDGDCHGGATCHCGTCTATCASTSSCSGVPGTTCATSTSDAFTVACGGESKSPGVCLQACGDGCKGPTTCVDGVCVAAPTRGDGSTCDLPESCAKSRPYNPDTCHCQTACLPLPCPSNAPWNQASCSCESTGNADSGTCAPQQCVADAVWDFTHCTCVGLLHFDGGAVTCPEGSAQTVEGQCVIVPDGGRACPLPDLTPIPHDGGAFCSSTLSVDADLDAVHDCGHPSQFKVTVGYACFQPPIMNPALQCRQIPGSAVSDASLYCCPCAAWD